MSAHKRQPRLYPFTEPLPQTITTSSGSYTPSIDWRVTTYKPNPFHGLDRVLFATDEWAHRHLSGRTHRLVLGWLCDWWDRRLDA